MRRALVILGVAALSSIAQAQTPLPGPAVPIATSPLEILSTKATPCGTVLTIDVKGTANRTPLTGKLWFEGAKEDLAVSFLVPPMSSKVMTVTGVVKVDCARGLTKQTLNVELNGQRTKRDVAPLSLKFRRDPADPPSTYYGWYVSSLSADVTCGRIDGVVMRMNMARRTPPAGQPPYQPVKIDWSLKYGGQTIGQDSSTAVPESGTVTSKMAKSGVAVNCAEGLKTMDFHMGTNAGFALNDVSFAEVYYGSPR
jgi:hypothetical protein